MGRGRSDNYLRDFRRPKDGSYHQSMGLQSLLVSRDTQVIRVLRPTLEKLAIEVEVCRGARSGNEILLSEKFDGVIVDCDDLQGGLDLLQDLRKGTSNKNSVAFAILNGQTTTQRAFELGANFVLQKPISPLNASRCFSAAVGFMARERRRYFRHAVDFPVRALFGQESELKATATNVSEGGMALRFKGKLPKGGLSKIAFSLPGSSVSLELRGDIAWADGAGRAGVRFVEIPKASSEQLETWLGEQLEKLDRQAI